MASPEEMLDSMIRNLEEKTGKSLDQWVAAVRATGMSRHGEIVKWLKGEHGMGHGYANLVASKALESAEAPAGDDLIEAQYSGKKAALRPIYDRLAPELVRFGKDVEVAPKKTGVSFRRSKQFALIQPTTNTRVDVGVNLKGVEPTGRLESAGTGAMCTHWVRLTSPDEIDAELLGWLREAYDRA